MHEIALAQGALEVCLDTAKMYQMKRINQLYFRKRKYSCVCTESFLTSFSFLAEGSIAQKAKVVIEECGETECADLELVGIEGEVEHED